MAAVAGGQPFSFNYNTTDMDTGLFVRADIWDVTASPSLVTQINLTHLSHGIYSGTYTGIVGKAYVINKLVYTDGTYTVIDTNRSPDSDDIQVISFSPTLMVNEVDGSILDMEIQQLDFDAEIETNTFDMEITTTDFDVEIVN